MIKYFRFDELNDKQRDAMKQALLKQRQALQALLRATDQSLTALAKKPVPKRTSKRKATRRTAKR
jgi:hypothetical protein